MGTRGPKPQPVERKRARGNPGKRALPALASVTILPQAIGVPDPPAGLGVSGLELWRRAWSTAITWLSPDSDWRAVEEACRLSDDLSIARSRYAATHDPKDGRLVVQLSSEFKRSLGTLGFTPTDRSALGVAEVKTLSKLEELRRARSEKS